jgi:DNA-binding NarL/FixJ family response regulator
MARVLLVDDHPLVGASLSQAIERLGSQVTLVAAIDGARQALREQAFDVLFLDINFPDGRGPDLLKDPDLAAHLPARRFLISGVVDADEIMMAFDDGAQGFISKGLSFADLVAAVEAVIADKHLAEGTDALIWQPEQAGFLPVGDVFPKESLLSPREREVFRYMRIGCQDKEIAHQVGRSIHTIRVQIRSIRRKRGLARRAEAIGV